MLRHRPRRARAHHRLRATPEPEGPRRLLSVSARETEQIGGEPYRRAFCSPRPFTSPAPSDSVAVRGPAPYRNIPPRGPDALPHRSVALRPSLDRLSPPPPRG